MPLKEKSTSRISYNKTIRNYTHKNNILMLESWSLEFKDVRHDVIRNKNNDVSHRQSWLASVNEKTNETSATSFQDMHSWHKDSQWAKKKIILTRISYHN